MQFMSKWEKKFGKYAVPNLSLVLILCYIVGYAMNLINGAFLSHLMLNPYEIIFHGQIWRLVTWIVVPPTAVLLDPLDLFFTAIMLFFYYSIGTSLERTWGTWRYNVYIFMGILFTVIGSFLCFGFYALTGMEKEVLEGLFMMGSMAFSTYYINMSIFLAFAVTFPNVQVYLMFVIPVKVKWMGVFYVVMMGAEFLLAAGPLAIFSRTAIGASLLNAAVFFFMSKNRMYLSPKQIKRRSEFKQKVKQGERPAGHHKCAICGRTEEDDPTLEFRYCSKCQGNYEYCQYHLFTHEHVRK